MSRNDPSDDEFERALLRSASVDLPDAGASERAWSRFAALTAGLAPTHASPSGASSSPETVGVATRVPGAVTAAKWCVAGAIVGSACTLALVSRHVAVSSPTSMGSTPMTPTPPSSARPPATPPPSGSSFASELQQSPRIASASTTSAPAALTPVERSRRPGDARAPGVTASASVPRDEGSTLAAEVAALDAAQSALDAGMPDQALGLLARYLRDYPKGKLVPEAEATGIEALAAKGENDRVIREATRFLQRYPYAPQRARVQELRAQAAPK